MQCLLPLLTLKIGSVSSLFALGAKSSFWIDVHPPLSRCIAAFRACKLRELEDLREDKTAIEYELQDTLIAVADSRHAAHNALMNVRSDAMFIKRILNKYRSLVQAFEEQKIAADSADAGQIHGMRQSISE